MNGNRITVASNAALPRSVLDIVSTKGQFRCYDLADDMSRIKPLLSWRSDYRSTKLQALKELLSTPGDGASSFEQSPGLSPHLTKAV